MELPEFSGKNLDKWAEEFSSFLRLIGQVNAPVQLLLDLIERCCKKPQVWAHGLSGLHYDAWTSTTPICPEAT